MKRIIQITTLFVIGLCVGAMLAQTPKPAPPIPDALQAKFWKAQTAVQADNNTVQTAQHHLADSQAQFQAVIKELTELCGKDFDPQMNAKGDPACVAKPVPPKGAK